MEHGQTNLDEFRHYIAAIPAAVPAPVFVKVGANDGIYDDPCQRILLDDTRWKGLLIEPLPECFAKLKANYGNINRFQLDQVAVGPVDDVQPFYYLDSSIEKMEGAKAWYTAIGSLDKAHISRATNTQAVDPYRRQLDIRVLLLNAVLRRNDITDIHLLHIDVEGLDYEVLNTLDFWIYKPLTIMLEHKHLSGEAKLRLLVLLQDRGYSIYDCGHDYFAVHNASNDILGLKLPCRSAGHIIW